MLEKKKKRTRKIKNVGEFDMVYIRTDANEIVATGHVMRCITIADKLMKYGEKVKFIVKDVDTMDLLEGKFEYVGIPTENIGAIYDEILYIKDIVNSEENTPKILLDLYMFDAEYMHKLKAFSKVISFDDMFNEYLPIDLLINYNPHYTIYDYCRRYHGKNIKLLLGMKYVPLREQFEKISSKFYKDVKNILLISGGGDKEHALLKIINGICEKNMDLKYKFHIIVGILNEDTAKLEKITDNKNIVLYHNVQNMAQLMRQMDIAISAAGTVLFECCKMQIPTIFYCMADNQEDVIEGFGKDDLMLYAGDIRYVNQQVPTHIIEFIEYLDKNPSIREEMRMRMQNQIDGKGAERIAREIIKL